MTQTSDNLGRPQTSGSLADLVTVSEEPSAQPLLRPDNWAVIGLLGVVFVAAHYWQWVNLVPVWLHSEDWQHGLVIPFISVYLVWANRARLRAATPRLCMGGLPIMVLGVLMETLGSYPGKPFIACLGMVTLVFGLVLYLAGPQVIRVVWLPILFWSLAMPWPALVYNDVAFWLQNLAASGTGATLGNWFHINVAFSQLDFLSRSGHACSLEVSGQCSGIHSLMAYVALGVAMAYLEDRPLWQRITLLACVIPVAILTNILRVIITTLMYYFDRPEMGQKFMHTLTGLLMIIPTFLILWMISGFLKRLFVEVEEEPAEGKAR